mgnify:FL=1
MDSPKWPPPTASSPSPGETPSAGQRHETPAQPTEQRRAASGQAPCEPAPSQHTRCVPSAQGVSTKEVKTHSLHSIVKKVSFCKYLVFYPEPSKYKDDLQISRIGLHLQRAADKYRAEQKIGPVLSKPHREKIFTERISL